MSVSKPKMINKQPTLSKYVCGGNRSKTTKVAWHYTGKAGVKGIDTINNWFNKIAKGYVQNGKYLYASSHFVMDLDGSIYSYIPMNREAWTTNDANSYSIGIECATTGSDDHYSDEEYKSMVHLGAWLSQEYKLDPRKDFIRHYDVTKKICPRYFVNNSKKWEQFKLDCYNLLKGKIKLNDIKNCTNGKGVVTEIPSTPSESTDKIKWKNGDYNCKVKTTGNLNLREGRGTNYKIIKNIPKGTEFALNYVNDNWGSTWDFDGKVAYFSCDYIEKAEIVNPESIVRIISNTLNVRKDSSFNSDIVAKLNKGEAYTIVEEKNGLGKLKSGQGWISMGEKYVEKIK